jgi:actin beta/gamma 1
MDNNNFIILDIGSGYCKAGFSGDAEPKIITPTVVGHPKNSDSENVDDTNNLIFGQEALNKKNELNLIHPVQKGIITDWENLAYFLDNLFKNYLQIDPKNYGMFITETPLTSESNRKKLVDLMFDTFQIPSIFINNGAILSLYGACKFSGFVIDSGYEFSEIVPLRNRFPFNDTIKKLDLGGNTINEYLEKLLIKNGVNPSYLNENEINKIKEQYCYVSQNNTKEEKEKNNINNIEITYELPDKSKIKINEERFLAPEINFHPELIGKEFGGLAQIFCNSMYEVDNCTKQQFDGTIVLSGGNTLFPNFAERLTKEIKQYYGGKFKNRIEMVVVPQRKYIQWIGASIFSIMNIFNGLCTSNQEYLENGASIVNKKCFY